MSDTERYNLPKYGTVGESILLDAPEGEFKTCDISKGLSIETTELGANLKQLANRGFVTVVEEHNHGNTYRLTEQGTKAQQELLDAYGLSKLSRSTEDTDRSEEP
jgi:DNA-binding HxlR family transcriptional regulator